MCVGVTGGGVVLNADVSGPMNMIGLTFGQPGHVPHHAHQPRVSCKNVRMRKVTETPTAGSYWERQSQPLILGGPNCHVSFLEDPTFQIFVLALWFCGWYVAFKRLGWPLSLSKMSSSWWFANWSRGHKKTNGSFFFFTKFFVIFCLIIFWFNKFVVNNIIKWISCGFLNFHALLEDSLVTKIHSFLCKWSFD